MKSFEMKFDGVYELVPPAPCEWADIFDLEPMDDDPEYQALLQAALAKIGKMPDPSSLPHVSNAELARMADEEMSFSI